MTEINFYHLTRSSLEQALPRLLEKTLQAGERAVVRRSKLYYLRALAGKAARLKEKRLTQVPGTGEQSE